MFVKNKIAIIVIFLFVLVLIIVPSRAQISAPKLIISCQLSDSMTVIDARTIRVKGTFSVGENPERMVTSPDNRYVAVTQPKNEQISIIRTENMRYGNAYKDPRMNNPVDVAFSPDSARLYVLDADTCSLVELHVPSFKVIRTLPLNGLDPRFMRISKNGTKIFVAHQSTGLITIVDLLAWEVVKQAGVGTKVGGLDLSRDNGRLVVSLPDESKVGVYKTTDLRLLNKIPVGAGASIVGVSSKDQVVVIDSVANDVTLFPLDRPSLRQIAVVGIDPRDLCFSPDGSMCYVINFSTDDLSVIDMEKGIQLGRLAVNGKGSRSVTWVW